jgi:hypothetical protein
MEATMQNAVQAPQNESEEKNVNENVMFTDVDVPADVSAQIGEKIKELKAKFGVKKVFVIVVEGDEDDKKPLYIGYFRRPNLMQFSVYMNFVQKDLIQANKQLANNVFLDGDKELVDDEDLFLYGTMQQLSHVIDSRNSDMVKR